jgi:TIR domain-containing protein
VSYRKDENKWEAGRIKDWLTRALGDNSVFRDTDSIRAGKDFRQELDAAVGKCKIMLALIGPTWLKRNKGTRRIDSENDWVRIEIESALQRHRLVIPVLLDDATMPRDTSLPESLRELAYRQAYTLRESTFERDVTGLIEQVRAHVAELKQ